MVYGFRRFGMPATPGADENGKGPQDEKGRKEVTKWASELDDIVTKWNNDFGIVFDGGYHEKHVDELKTRLNEWANRKYIQNYGRIMTNEKTKEEK